MVVIDGLSDSFKYVISVKCLAASYYLVRDELAFRWRCLSKTFSQRDMVLWSLRNQTGPVFNFF